MEEDRIKTAFDILCEKQGKKPSHPVLPHWQALPFLYESFKAGYIAGMKAPSEHETFVVHKERKE